LGSHPQANIDEMLVAREFPRDLGRGRSGPNPLGAPVVQAFHQC